MRGLAISTRHVVHLVSQFADGTNVRVTGLDEATGATIFDLPVPESVERSLNVRQGGGAWVCAPEPDSKLLPTAVTRPMRRG